MKASELLDQLQTEFKAQSKLLTQITLEAELQLQVATDTKARLDQVKQILAAGDHELTEEEMKQVGFENSEKNER